MPPVSKLRRHPASRPLVELQLLGGHLVALRTAAHRTGKARQRLVAVLGVGMAEAVRTGKPNAPAGILPQAVAVRVGCGWGRNDTLSARGPLTNPS